MFTPRHPPQRYHTPRALVVRNAVILTVSVLLTFAVLRATLHAAPDTDFNVGRFNIHHLFVGLALIALGGIPLAIFRGSTARLDVAVAVFGVGLGMALDEWVYLIATDGSNASYLLPVSFWGGLLAVAIALGYTVGLTAYRARQRRARQPASRTVDTAVRKPDPSEPA